MVGVAVGLLAVFVVLQALAVYENQRRTTTSGSDAQQSGLMGMFAIEEAIRNAGSGYASDPTLSCQNFFSYSDPDGPGPLGVSTTAFGSTTPARLVNNAGGAGGASTDALEVRAASRITGSIPTWLTGNGMNAASRTLPVERAFDFAVNDLILVTSPAPNPTKNCALMRVSAVDLVNRMLTVAHDPTQAPEYNPPTADLTTNNWPGYGTRAGDPERFTKGSLVYRVGSTAGGGIETARYCISRPAATNRFELRIDSSATCNTTPCTAPGCQVLANDVVSIQAQYGLASGTRALNAFRQTHNIMPFAILPRDVATWRNPDHTDVTTLTPAELSKRVKALRLAVIARSGKREGNIVTPVCAAVTTTGPCACQNATANFGPCPWRDTAADPAPPVDLRSGPGDTEWQFYRYKVFETTVPLRNSIWPDLL